MARPNDEFIRRDEIALANTRPVLTFGMPFPWFAITLFGPPIILVFTFDVRWMALWIPLVLIGRALVARDANRPRILWLWLMSGSAIADRSTFRGESPSVFAPRDKWFGNYNG